MTPGNQSRHDGRFDMLKKASPAACTAAGVASHLSIAFSINAYVGSDSPGYPGFKFQAHHQCISTCS